MAASGAARAEAEAEAEAEEETEAAVAEAGVNPCIHRRGEEGRCRVRT